MADEYDEQAERLLPCGKYWLCVDGGHDRQCPGFCRLAVAATLREAGKREAALLWELNRISEELGLPPGIGPAEGWLRTQLENYKTALMERDELRREVERLTHELLVIGDMAVVDYEDKVVGMVDAVVRPPATYADRRRAELKQHAAMQAEIERLKNLLRYAAPSVDHFTCLEPPYSNSECRRCEIEKALEAK